MRRAYLNGLMIGAVVLFTASTGGAQLPRTRMPGGPDAGLPSGGTPRDARFPYAGQWSGMRVMPAGSDQIAFKFTVTDGQYAGLTLHPGGGTSPQNNIVAGAGGLTWEQPNSGGGTWVFNVRLAGPDSMVGTLFLRDAPANLTPAPRGTMVLTRHVASHSK